MHMHCRLIAYTHTLVCKLVHDAGVVYLEIIANKHDDWVYLVSSVLVTDISGTKKHCFVVF